MAFKVEDGHAFDDSNSYGAVADADAYHLDRGNADWAALTPDQKQNRLVKATDYLDQRYGGRFIGERATEDQALEWPRKCTGSTSIDWDTDTKLGSIPRKLQYACFEYAVRATERLAPDPVVTESGVSTVLIKEKMGPIESEYAPVGGDTAQIQILRSYPGADMYLRGLVRPSGGVIR